MKVICKHHKDCNIGCPHSVMHEHYKGCYSRCGAHFTDAYADCIPENSIAVREERAL